MVRIATAACGILSIVSVCYFVAAEVAEQSDKRDTNVAPLMSDRGKLVHSDHFTTGPSDAWRVPNEKWVVVAGATQGAELNAGKYGAVMRVKLPLRNAVIQYSFKLAGARATTLSINGAKRHNSRVVNNRGVIGETGNHKPPDDALIHAFGFHDHSPRAVQVPA